MSRRSERELDRAIDRLAGGQGTDPDPVFLYRDAEAGEFYEDPEATVPVDPDEVDALFTVPLRVVEMGWKPHL